MACTSYIIGPATITVPPAGGLTNPALIIPANTSGSTLQLGDGTVAGASMLEMLGSNSKYNFLVACNFNVFDALEITPSTAAGGSTFSTPAILVLRTGDIRARGVGVCLRATAIETRTSTVTLTNSTQLTYAIPAIGTYALRLIVFFYATTAGTNGITANVNYSGTFTAVGSYVTGYLMNGTTTTTGIQPTQISATVNNALAPFTIASTGSIAAATPCVYVVEGNLIATGTGTVAFAFAQNSSGTNTANLGVGSYMAVTQLS